MKLRYLSVCSGIEAVTVAWEFLGFQAIAFSEIEPFPAAELAHHYPSVPNIGDMTVINGKKYAGEVDILVGGTPCQAFSVAGLRKGLADKRGNLALKFVELVNEINPPLVVWENVPGVLSSADNAFGCFLGGLAGEDVPFVSSGKKWSDAGLVFGPKRTIAWRCLCAQYFNLAQRRKRLFVISGVTDGIDPRKILFEQDGLRRDSAPCRNPRQGSPRTTSRSVKVHIEGGQCPCLTQVSGHIGDIGMSNQKVATLKTKAVAVQQNQLGEVRTGEVCGTLNTNSSASGRNAPMVLTLQGNMVRPNAGCHGKGWSKGGISYTLTSADRHAVLTYPSEDGVLYEVVRRGSNAKPFSFAPKVLAQWEMGGHCTPLKVDKKTLVIVNDQEDNFINVDEDHISPRLRSETQANTQSVAYRDQVRRLTPVECERLQGFPDGYTKIPWRGKCAADCPEGHRYKAIGNAMAVNVMHWIGKRIAKYSKEINNEHT